MLRIENLHAEIDGKEIFEGLSFTVNAGEVHTLIGASIGLATGEAERKR